MPYSETQIKEYKTTSAKIWKDAADPHPKVPSSSYSKDEDEEIIIVGVSDWEMCGMALSETKIVWAWVRTIKMKVLI